MEKLGHADNLHGKPFNLSAVSLISFYYCFRITYFPYHLNWTISIILDPASVNAMHYASNRATLVADKLKKKTSLVKQSSNVSNFLS